MNDWISAPVFGQQEFPLLPTGVVSNMLSRFREAYPHVMRRATKGEGFGTAYVFQKSSANAVRNYLSDPTNQLISAEVSRLMDIVYRKTSMSLVIAGMNYPVDRTTIADLQRLIDGLVMDNSKWQAECVANADAHERASETAKVALERAKAEKAYNKELIAYIEKLKGNLGLVIGQMNKVGLKPKVRPIVAPKPIITTAVITPATVLPAAPKRTRRRSNSKVTEKTAAYVLQCVEQGEKQVDIAARLKLSTSTISVIKTGKWKND